MNKIESNKNERILKAGVTKNDKSQNLKSLRRGKIDRSRHRAALAAAEPRYTFSVLPLRQPSPVLNISPFLSENLVRVTIESDFRKRHFFQKNNSRLSIPVSDCAAASKPGSAPARHFNKTSAAWQSFRETSLLRAESMLSSRHAGIKDSQQSHLPRATKI